MKILIATTDLQGTRPGDYHCTVEGELVTPVVGDLECASPDRCGCGRGFPGLASAKATTTAMVVEREFIGDDDVRDAVRSWLERCGWVELLAEHGDDPDAELDDIVDDHLDGIARVCDAFPVGTIVERDGTLIASRACRRAA